MNNLEIITDDEITYFQNDSNLNKCVTFFIIIIYGLLMLVIISMIYNFYFLFFIFYFLFFIIFIFYFL
jgi:hypothetical protein